MSQGTTIQDKVCNFLCWHEFQGFLISLLSGSWWTTLGNKSGKLWGISVATGQASVVRGKSCSLARITVQVLKGLLWFEWLQVIPKLDCIEASFVDLFGEAQHQLPRILCGHWLGQCGAWIVLIEARDTVQVVLVFDWWDSHDLQPCQTLTRLPCGPFWGNHLDSWMNLCGTLGWAERDVVASALWSGSVKVLHLLSWSGKFMSLSLCQTDSLPCGPFWGILCGAFERYVVASALWSGSDRVLYLLSWSGKFMSLSLSDCYNAAFIASIWDLFGEPLLGTQWNSVSLWPS